MRLYHGSNVRIGKIDLAKSRPNKDFGRGFYLTEEAEQAMRMAEQMPRLEGKRMIGLDSFWPIVTVIRRKGCMILILWWGRLRMTRLACSFFDI